MPRPPHTEVDAGDDEPSVLDSIERIGSYYRGTVCNLHRGPERGMIRTATGREIPFVMQHLTMRGNGRGFADLSANLVVGYDVSWTSHGLQVSTIWIPD